MTINRSLFKLDFTVDAIPQWPCPTCKTGVLSGTENDFTVSESATSKGYHKHEDWEPYWISGVFCGTLNCNNSKCLENVAIAGTMSVEESSHYVEELNDEFFDSYEALKPQVFIPPLEIFPINPNVPDAIKDHIMDAFRVHWIDPSSCANKIRIVVEAILDHFKIKRTTINKSKKRVLIPLHHRLDAYKIKYPHHTELLFAIKWIGNSGSHTSKPTIDDVLDGLEILEHAVNRIFDTENKRLVKLSKTIIKNKGVPKKQKRKIR